MNDIERNENDDYNEEEEEEEDEFTNEQNSDFEEEEEFAEYEEKNIKDNDNDNDNLNDNIENLFKEDTNNHTVVANDFIDDENNSISDDDDTQNHDLKKSETPKIAFKRKKLTNKNAIRIWNAYNEKGPKFAKEFTLSLGYKKTTYFKVIACRGQIDAKWSHPEHSTKWKENQIDMAINWIEDNPVLTLEEIISKGIDNGFPFIFPSTLSSYLNGKLITLKKVKLNPIARNSNETKDQRIEYCSKFLDNISKTFVFIDEMGLSICTLRNRGRSRKGKNAVVIAPLSRAPNLSVCMGVCKEIGLVHYETQNKAYDGKEFYDFLKNLINVCKEKGLKNVCFVMDNCRIHKKDGFDCEKLCAKNKIDLYFLPPYSPELNPIENVFSMLKNNIRRLLATTYRNQLMETCSS